jgi:predicted helicase
VAPYAIGHFKISVVLEDLGYQLKDNERFNLYLTNTLEMKQPPVTGFIPGLTEETKLAKKVKDEIPILVVLGNPPYSVSSENKSDFIESLMETYKEDVKSERNIQPLSDDYIKFIRFAHWRVEKTGQGIVGMITNNSYLSGLIHRGMRKKLLESFDEIYILNLHGNARIGEKAPDGSKDENVFDIMQGVSIALFVKQPFLDNTPRQTRIWYADLYGLRDKKYDYLLNHNVKKTRWQELKPAEPYFFFVPKEFEGEKEYQRFWSITEIFKEFSSGIKTHRDHFVIGFTKEELKNRLLLFTGPQSDEMIASALELKNTADFNLSKVRKEVKDENWEEKIYPYAYRPFDNRFICYLHCLIDRDRHEIMRHLLNKNLGLIIPRGTKTIFNHGIVTTFLVDVSLGGATSGSETNVFPLYLYDHEKPDNKKGGLSTPMMVFDKGDEKYQAKKPYPNFKSEFLKAVREALGRETTPEEIFYYIYGVLYSPAYRKKYEEFLKIDFPRIPIIKDYKVFQKMSHLGKELVELHLLKSPVVDKQIGSLSSGNNRVEKVRYDQKKRRVYINQTQYFEDMPKDIWTYYIGGYQVLDKWLKSRKDRVLTKEEIDHFLKVAMAIKQTIELQKKIDKIYIGIEKSL